MLSRQNHTSASNRSWNSHVESLRISAAAAEPDARPTAVRYGVLFFLCTLALLLYIDRICIGQAETSIRNELGFDKKQMGWMFSAFMLAYCLFEVPTGHWGDRFGSRGVIARIVVWWSMFTALTGAAFGFYSLVAIRFLFGAGEAGAFPNAARVVTRWFPIGERGFARGAITTTSMLGGAIAPPLAAALIGVVGLAGDVCDFWHAGNWCGPRLFLLVVSRRPGGARGRQQRRARS